MFKKLLGLFSNKPIVTDKAKTKASSNAKKAKPKIESGRIGELGEHKINIQLDQLPSDCRYLSDIMIPNPKSKSGYSQIDHIVISPYGIFVIETKNYNGEIKGGRQDRNWTVSNRFKMYNPLMQNYGHIKALESVLSKFPSLLFISMVSFTMRCRFSIEPELRKIESNQLVIYDVELSEFISRKTIRLKATMNHPVLAPSTINEIYSIIQSANISDPALRAQHVEKAKAGPQ